MEIRFKMQFPMHFISKRNLIFFFVGILFALIIIFGVRLPPFSRLGQSDLTRLSAIEQVKKVLKLGVIETRVSQVYEVTKPNLTIKSIPIPWTKQKSMIGVTGNVSFGYDLTKAAITAPQPKVIEVRLPEPSVLSIELDYNFIYEDDTFLNRLTPDDRNTILQGVKKAVSDDLFNANIKNQVANRTNELMKDFESAYGIQIKLNSMN